MGSTVFIYQAVTTAGTQSSGEIAAASRADALSQLSQRGLVPMALQEKESGASNSNRRSFSFRLRWRRDAHISARELLALSQSLASLLNAGLMVDRALIIAGPLASSPAARSLIESLLKSVRAGQTLSRAFANSGQRLPPYFVSMVDAGEVGGSLPAAFSRLADIQKRNLEIHERVRSALVYPSLLAGMMLFTIVVLLMFVLPRFEQLFVESESPLPWSTQAVLSLGRLVANWWWLGLGSTLIVVLAFRGWVRSARGRRQFHGWLLRTRMTMGLPIALNTARLLRTISTLTANGLPLPVALRIARGTVVNERLLEALGQVTRDVQAGEALSQSFARARVFPPVATQLARVGEETGHLDQLLMSASTILEEESHMKLERMLTLVVPLLTITMGMLVAGLIGSVLIGLLSINDLAF